MHAACTHSPPEYGHSPVARTHSHTQLTPISIAFECLQGFPMERGLREDIQEVLQLCVDRSGAVLGMLLYGECLVAYSLGQELPLVLNVSGMTRVCPDRHVVTVGCMTFCNVCAFRRSAVDPFRGEFDVAAAPRAELGARLSAGVQRQGLPAGVRRRPATTALPPAARAAGPRNPLPTTDTAAGRSWWRQASWGFGDIRGPPPVLYCVHLHLAGGQPVQGPARRSISIW
jgi:hypothetical protein